MKLSEYRKDADYFSSSASAINRSLSYSGIAIIWLFSQTEENYIVLDKILLFALLGLALSLLVDLAQYCVGYFRVDQFHRQQELASHNDRGTIIEDEIDVLAPTGIKKITTILFWCKISSNGIAYTLIIIFLLSNIFVK